MESQYITVHPDNPQKRFISQICEILKRGGVGVIPTDSAYALCCKLEQKDAMERIARIREISKKPGICLSFQPTPGWTTVYSGLSRTIFRDLIPSSCTLPKRCRAGL